MQWENDYVHNPSLAAVPMACAPTATHAAHGVRTSRGPNAEVPVGIFSGSFFSVGDCAGAIFAGIALCFKPH